MAKFDPTVKLRVEAEERYAQQRAYGYRPHEAARRAQLNRRNGTATKYENKPRVQARIAYLRRDDLTTEMREEKRRQIEDRLEAAAFGDILRECATIDEKTGLPVIDWAKVMASDLSIIVNEVIFDKDGRLARLRCDDALAAAAQLRDMSGFKAAEKRDTTVRISNERTDETAGSPILFFALKMLGNAIEAKNVDDLQTLVRSRRSALGERMCGPLQDWGKAIAAFQRSSTTRNIERLLNASRDLSSFLGAVGVAVSPETLVGSVRNDEGGEAITL